MILRQFLHQEPVAVSYLLGCVEKGAGAVIDPVFPIEPYLQAAEALATPVCYVVDTHLHADHLSAARALAEAAGATYVLHEGAQAVFAFHAARDGETLSLGNVELSVLHTPGHTPEHLSRLVTDQTRAPEPWALLSSHTLMVGDVGRTELASDVAHAARRVATHAVRDTMPDVGRRSLRLRGQRARCSTMTLDQLRIFVAAAERQHVTRAAKALNLVQSAVGASIAAQEGRHGARLFDRVGRGIELTEAGTLFLIEARAVLARAARAELVLFELGDLKRGTLHLQASHTIASYWLPRHLVAFRLKHPGIDLRLTIGNLTTVAAAIVAGSAELGFVEGAFDDPALEAHIVARDQLVIVVGHEHPWAALVHSGGPEAW